MKYRINAILPFLISFLVTTAAISGDKFKSLRDITPYPNTPSITSLPTTVNQNTTPIEKATALDEVTAKAIKPQMKSDVVENNEMIELHKLPTTSEDTQVAQEIENLFRDNPVEVKKPATHKVKEKVKKYKRRHTRVKTIKDEQRLNPEKTVIEKENVEKEKSEKERIAY